ncbi:MAG: phosphoglycerate kinase, partial [Candidatus Portnoybacteria bacterium]|nr:phosphoglycerate kinase [Candidatus Portnoybacteria bacterium]
MRTLSQIGEIAGKKILVRDDFNVTMDENGKIQDDFKIRASLPTIEHLLKNQARIILMAHLGRPLEHESIRDLTDKDQRKKFSLRPIAERLSALLNKEVILAPDCIGPEAENLAASLKKGEILLLENLRFHKDEDDNNDDFAKKLSLLGEIYINDAFGNSHREDASMEAIVKHLPSFGGFLLHKEVEALSRIRQNPERPLAVIIGGAKISTKIKLIKEFLDKADNLMLGGALANTVLGAKGLAIGKSLIEENIFPEVKKMEITNPKLHIPVDVILSEDKNGQAENRVRSEERREG